VLADWDDQRIERLEDGLERCGGMEEKDAALTRELVYGVARFFRLYDHLAARFLKPGSQPKELLRILRLAAHQLFALDRIPPHAVGHTLVELLKTKRCHKLTGVANAVIRRLSEMRLEERRAPGPEGRIDETLIPEDPAIRYNLPELLVRDLKIEVLDHGRSLESLNQLPHLCTRTRHGKTLPNLRGIVRRDGPWAWWDDPKMALQGPVGDGICVVQDFSQGAVLEHSGARPGDWVLDLCAAPGGKALAFSERGCRVVASDVSTAKAIEMGNDLGSAAMCCVQDGRRPAFGQIFDIVLVDAPCSNTGVLGRRPEARLRYTREHLDSLLRLQKGLLQSAARLVKPDGRLIYSTCSVSPRENQAVAHTHDGWRLLREQISWPDDWQAGGYVAVLVRS
jgi:16S rRNA (cytosine967-C5)-methyltransferase